MTDKETAICLSVSQGRHPIGPDALERRRQEEGMIIALYIAAAVIMAVASLYFAWRNMDFRKFLAGAFFVSSGILFYLYLAYVAVLLLGTSFVETPQPRMIVTI